MANEKPKTLILSNDFDAWISQQPWIEDVIRETARRQGWRWTWESLTVRWSWEEWQRYIEGFFRKNYQTLVTWERTGLTLKYHPELREALRILVKREVGILVERAAN